MISQCRVVVSAVCTWLPPAPLPLSLPQSPPSPSPPYLRTRSPPEPCATRRHLSLTRSYQEDHTSRRGSLCAELTEDIQQYILETDLQLRIMYEAHYEHVTQAALFNTCLDTAGMDALYEEACCGHDG